MTCKGAGVPLLEFEVTTKKTTAGGSAQVQAQDPVRMTQLQNERMNDCNSKARLHLLLLYVQGELRIY